MKTKLLGIFLILTQIGFAQEKIITKSGIIIFEASVPSFEEVKAKNESVSCVLNTKTGEIASLALMKGFRFKIALMEEHFNENYVESDTYPKATFKGKIENFDYSKIDQNSEEYNVKGTMEIHGKSKEISIIAKIKKTSNGLEFLSNFDLNADDFNIKIPSVVSKKVSKKVNVDLNFNLK
ncbi:MAG: YceI family protein [Flavobacterium sp.]|nr:YceI family protein [Flavobacterium sp.]